MDPVGDAGAHESSPDLARTRPDEDFVALHVRPWVFADFLKIEGRLNGVFLVKVVGMLLVCTWFGAFMSWNVGGRAAFLGGLSSVGDDVWSLIENEAGVRNLRPMIYALAFYWKQTSLVLAPFFTLVPLVVWAGLTTVGLQFFGRREPDAFVRLLVLALVAQWLNVWNAIPLTGGVIAGAGKFVFLVYSVKRSFALSFNQALLAMYALPLVVVFAALGFAIVFSFTI